MDSAYQNWYNRNCCSDKESAAPYYDCEMPPYLNNLPDASFKDRLLGMVGNKILFSIAAPIDGKGTLTGSLCYVGCDYIIITVCRHRKPLPLYIPINMICFFALKQ